ncbi:hypothetical protein BHM03_00059574 [Ensete ventricosum]|nr:hypothetical protein BHM03_00059574 [Ensete ventricosum]
MELKRDSGEGGRTESNRFPAPINRRGQVEASNPGVEFRVTVVGGTQKRCAFHRIQSFNTRRSHRYPSRGPPRDRCLLVIAWGPLSDFIATRETRLPRAPLPLAPTSHLPRPAQIKRKGGGGGGGRRRRRRQCRMATTCPESKSIIFRQLLVLFPTENPMHCTRSQHLPRPPTPLLMEDDDIG